MRRALIAAWVLVVACGDDSGQTDAETSGTGTDVGPGTTVTDGRTPNPTSSGGSSFGVTTDAGSSTGLDPDTSTGTETDGDDDGPDVDVSDPQLYEFELDPLALDPTVVDSIELQYAQLDTRAEPIGKLVFFLSGFTNTPASWRDHGRQLAGYGFHVVLPHYNNRWRCDGTPNCNEDTRWEALTGEDTSSIIEASPADSAEGRVITMLLHLRDEHPGGDWGYYLGDDDSLRDEQVIIAGISHGAASSGLFASRRPFSRAVMHSGGWGATGDTPATPIGSFYGFSHTEDEQHSGHLSAWESAGLLGAPTSIDDASPPYGDARQLITSAPSTYPHCSVAVHGSSPMNGDDFVFDPAWRYLYGAPQ